MSLRKPREECTLSEYQFFWCEGAGHREAGIAMPSNAVCSGCAAEWYAMTAPPFDRRAANALADEVAVLVRRQVIDSRSPAADALLDYREPPSSPRADRLALLDAHFQSCGECHECAVESGVIKTA